MELRLESFPPELCKTVQENATLSADNWTILQNPGLQSVPMFVFLQQLQRELQYG